MISHPFPIIVKSQNEPIRLCGADEFDTILEIINDAAFVYKGVIAPDCWHEPYMSAKKLHGEIADGITFYGFHNSQGLCGVMGIQQVLDAMLIRHAYVRSADRGKGIGSQLIRHLRSAATQPMLVGTWIDATWAVAFYKKHGFDALDRRQTERLLKKYWRIPTRQIETSVVLADAAAMRTIVIEKD